VEESAFTPRPPLLPGKILYPFYRRLGGPQGRSGRAENLVPTGIGFRTVQAIVAIPTELPGLQVSHSKERKFTDIFGDQSAKCQGQCFNERVKEWMYQEGGVQEAFIIRRSAVYNLLRILIS